VKILLVDDEKDIAEILTFTFESEVEAEFLYAETGNQAIKVIGENSDIDLIVCDYNMPDGNGGDVYKHLLDNNIDIPYVMCSSDQPQDHNVFSNDKLLLSNIVKPDIFSGVEETLKKYEEYSHKTEDKETTKMSRNDSEYSMINIVMLKNLTSLPADIFIKVSEDKFLKVYNKDASFTQEDEDKYLQKNIKKLLVKKNDAKSFVDSICGQIESMIEEANGKSNEEKVLDIHSVIMETVSTLGLSKEIVRATEKSVEFAMEVFKENKEFKGLYKHIFGHQGKYITKHSIALAYVSCGLLRQLPWDTFENRNKLTIASFFHDAAIKVPDFDEGTDFDEIPDSVKNFKDHPGEAAELIKKFKEIPPDVDRIILEHHEKPDGTGFPKGLGASQISPLGSLFIVAHAVIECMFQLEDQQEKLNMEGVLDCINVEIYSQGNFKKVIGALKELNLFA
jgi:response regulator RpfG family c-di-GMP phosphodiesterase